MIVSLIYTSEMVVGVMMVRIVKVAVIVVGDCQR
jgi:hypothetical protein